MAHDVFISYATEDKPLADAVVATLESSSIRCWIAPRDILPGSAWSDSIMTAMSASRAVVLVFTSRANSSAQVRREVQTAFEQGRLVIPLRVEDVRPESGLAYYLGSVHWLDAMSPPFTAHLAALAKTVQLVIGSTSEIATPTRTPSESIRVPPLPDSAGIPGAAVEKPPPQSHDGIGVPAPSQPKRPARTGGRLPRNLLRGYVIVTMLLAPFQFIQGGPQDADFVIGLSSFIFGTLVAVILIVAILRQHVGLFIIGTVGALTAVFWSQVTNGGRDPSFPFAMLIVLANLATVFFTQTKFASQWGTEK